MVKDKVSQMPSGGSRYAWMCVCVCVQGFNTGI